MFWCLLQILFEVLVFWLCHFHLRSCIWTWQVISISVVVLADAGFPFYGPNKVLGCICTVPIDFNHLHILFRVFFSPPDAHHFNMTVVSKCCNLLVFYGLNKVYTKAVPHFGSERVKRRGLFQHAWGFYISSLLTQLVQFLQSLTILMTKQIWLLGSSAVSHILCRNRIAGNNNWYCFDLCHWKLLKSNVSYVNKITRGPLRTSLL